jgi:biopolymer transport protein ExbD
MPLKLNQDDQTSINLTPMIDIVFLLIIFFMIGTRFSELNESERNIALTLPQVATGQALTTAPRKRVINVVQNGQILLDDQPVTLADLESELASAKQQYQKLGVVVRGDADSRYEAVAQVIAACRRVGISIDLPVRVASLP